MKFPDEIPNSCSSCVHFEQVESEETETGFCSFYDRSTSGGNECYAMEADSGRSTSTGTSASVNEGPKLVFASLDLSRFGVGRFLLSGLKTSAYLGVALGIVGWILSERSAPEGASRAAVGLYDLINWHLRFGFAYGVSAGFFLHTLGFAEREFRVKKDYWQHAKTQRYFVGAAVASIAWTLLFSVLFLRHDFDIGGVATLALAGIFAGCGWNVALWRHGRERST